MHAHAVFGDPVAALAASAFAFLLGHLLALKTRGAAAALAFRLAGAIGTAAVAMAFADRGVDLASSTGVMATYMLAPFALGWVYGAHDAPEMPWVAAVDIVALAALTLVGAMREVAGSHVAVAALLLMGGYVAAIVYTAIADRVRFAVPVAVTLIGWVAFSMAVAPATTAADRALTLAPLLVLMAALRSAGRLAFMRA